MSREPLELTVQVETDGTYVGTARAALDALRREYRRLGLRPEPGDVLTWVLLDRRAESMTRPPYALDERTAEALR